MKIKLHTTSKKMLADIFTPVALYLRLRDEFRDTILLESTNTHGTYNSLSFICVNAIGGIEIKSGDAEIKFPNQKAEAISCKPGAVADLLWNYMQKFETTNDGNSKSAYAQGLYGYTSFDAIPMIEGEKTNGGTTYEIPLCRYRLYQYVIAFDHFNDEVLLLENNLPGLDSEMKKLESLINSKNIPVYPFKIDGEESSNITDDEYLSIVEKGIKHCHRGDVFQVVLSRRFYQKFKGDEFNVYRALRHINPSPYLFYFDYGDYKLIGSSPEAQLVIQKSKAIVHPIAGTFARSGNEDTDHRRSEELLTDAKENAEHVMLVDLARNDLSKVCNNVSVTSFKKIQYFSHVIHLVSEVMGDVEENANPFKILFATFPAGTLSGAPKHRALQIISEFEKNRRGFYGGTIGFVGFNGDCNHAIMIRTFLSYGNTLVSQAGAGVVAASNPSGELKEVNHKLNALKKAIIMAEEINK